MALDWRMGKQTVRLLFALLLTDFYGLRVRMFTCWTLITDLKVNTANRSDFDGWISFNYSFKMILLSSMDEYSCWPC